MKLLILISSVSCFCNVNLIGKFHTTENLLVFCRQSGRRKAKEWELIDLLPNKQLYQLIPNQKWRKEMIFLFTRVSQIHPLPSLLFPSSKSPISFEPCCLLDIDENVISCSTNFILITHTPNSIIPKYGDFFLAKRKMSEWEWSVWRKLYFFFHFPCEKHKIK